LLEEQTPDFKSFLARDSDHYRIPSFQLASWLAESLQKL